MLGDGRVQLRYVLKSKGIVSCSQTKRSGGKVKHGRAMVWRGEGPIGEATALFRGVVHG